MRDAQNLDVLDDIAVDDGARSAAMSDRSALGGLRWSLPIAVLIIVADQVTKRWALDRLISGSCDTPDACIDLIAGARFHLVFNTGAAFARGQGFGPILGVAVSIISVVLLVASWRRVDKAGALLLGAIAGGAIGNLIDRVTRAEDGFLSGAVVDFIDLGWWPVFNVADIAVVCGVLGFVVLSWWQGRDEAAGDVVPGDAAPADSESE